MEVETLKKVNMLADFIYTNKWEYKKQNMFLKKYISFSNLITPAASIIHNVGSSEHFLLTILYHMVTGLKNYILTL